ncbi:MAG: helix-turn-helix domain-containing protein [Promethearchaeota archaeon]
MDSKKASLARIKLKFPEKLWISYIFQKFPDIRMEIQYFLPFDLEKSIGNSVIDIQHYKIDDIIKEVREHPSVLELNVLERNENFIKINVKTKDPYLLYAVIENGVLIDFPVRVKEGYAYWRLISSRNGIDKLLTVFDKKSIEYELLKIGNSPYDLEDDVHRLTFEENFILNKAIDLGFFEVPRKISLEELAKSLGKSKSALSVMLRKIIKKKVMLEK